MSCSPYVSGVRDGGSAKYPRLHMYTELGAWCMYGLPSTALGTLDFLGFLLRGSCLSERGRWSSTFVCRVWLEVAVVVGEGRRGSTGFEDVVSLRR